MDPDKLLLSQFMDQYSFVQPYKEYGSDCSYCRRPHNKGRVAYGFHTYHITAIDYETYLELGYLRSGSHVYKPSNDRSCCPNYPVRIDALAYTPTHSHRKLLKRITQYLNGTRLITLPETNTDVFGRCIELTLEGRAEEAAEAVARYRAEGVPTLDPSPSSSSSSSSASSGSTSNDSSSLSFNLNRNTASLASRLGMVFLENDNDDDDEDATDTTAMHDIRSNGAKSTKTGSDTSSSSSSSLVSASTTKTDSESSKKSKLHFTAAPAYSSSSSGNDKLLVPHAIPLYHPFQHISPDSCTEITDKDIQRSYVAHIIANVFHVYIENHKSDTVLPSSVSSTASSFPTTSNTLPFPSSSFTLTPDECLDVLQRSVVEEPSQKLLRSSSSSSSHTAPSTKPKSMNEEVSTVAAVCNAAFIITSILFDHRSSSVHTASSSTSSSSALSTSVTTTLVNANDSSHKSQLRGNSKSTNNAQRIDFQRTVAKDIAAFLTSRCRPVGLVAVAAGPGYINISLTSLWPPMDLQRSTIYHAIQQEHTGKHTEGSRNPQSPATLGSSTVPSLPSLASSTENARRGKKRGSESSLTALTESTALTVSDLLPLIPGKLNVTNVKTPLEKKALSIYYRKQQIEREATGKMYMKMDPYYQPGRDELDIENQIYDIENQEEELVEKLTGPDTTENNELEAVMIASGLPTDSSSSSSSTESVSSSKFIVTKLPPPHETEDERTQRIRHEIEQRELEEDLQKEIEKSTEALEKMAADGIGNRMKLLRERAIENRNAIKEAVTMSSSSSSSSASTPIPLLPFGIGNHKLTVTLARPSYGTDSHELYARFNMALHRGKPSSQAERNYRRHLIDSPIVPFPAWKLGYLYSFSEHATEQDRETINSMVDKAHKFYEPLYPPRASEANPPDHPPLPQWSNYAPNRLLERMMETIRNQTMIASVSSSSSSTVSNENTTNNTTTASTFTSSSSSSSSAESSVYSFPLLTKTIMEQCTELGIDLDAPSLLPSEETSMIVRSFAMEDKVLSYINMYITDLLDPVTGKEIDTLFRSLPDPSKFGDNAGDAVDKVFNNFPFPVQKLDSYIALPEGFTEILRRLNDIAFNQRMEPGVVLFAIYILLLELIHEGYKFVNERKEYFIALDKYTEEMKTYTATREPFGTTDNDDSVLSSSGTVNNGLITDEEKNPEPLSPPVIPIEPTDTSEWLTEDNLLTKLGRILDTHSSRLLWMGRAVRSLLEEVNHVITTYSEGTAKYYDEQRRQYLATLPNPPSYDPVHPPFTPIDEMANLTTVAGVSYQRNRPFPYITQPPSDDLFGKYFKRIYTPGALRHGAEPPPSPTTSNDASSSFSSSSSNDDHRIGISGWDLPFGYGSFFHEYRIDGVLIGVSVIDILPTRIASVYFYYDVDFRYLELGKLSALVELWLVQQINQFTKQYPELSTFLPSDKGPLCRHWDPNFYVHTCPQMSYKRQYQPMEIVSPVLERGIWVPFNDHVLKELDTNPEAPLGTVYLPVHSSSLFSTSRNQLPSLFPTQQPEYVLSAVSRMQQYEENRAISLLSTLLVQLRDGSLYPFGGLSDRSKSICRIGLQRYVVGVGRRFAERTLLDPNGAASSGSQMEDVLKARKTRIETRLAKLKEHQAFLERERLRLRTDDEYDDVDGSNSNTHKPPTTDSDSSMTIEEQFLQLLQQSLQNHGIPSSGTPSNPLAVPFDTASLASLQQLMNTLIRSNDHPSMGTYGTDTGYPQETLDHMNDGEEEENNGEGDEGNA